MAFNIYALLSYYFHPFYDNTRLPNHIIEDINTFLIENLDADSLASWQQFNFKEDIFKNLLEKDLNDPIIFWKTASSKHRGLAEFVLKLLNIPASTGQIERIFSNWSFVHSKLRNRLSFDKSKKLLHCYYSLKTIEEIQSEDY
jgi:hypothetical protein